MTFNHGVEGSSPSALTSEIRHNLNFYGTDAPPLERLGTRRGHIIVRHSAIKDHFPYETCRWSAGQPDQAKRWFDELELTSPQNVRARLAQSDAESGKAANPACDRRNQFLDPARPS